MPFSTSFPCCCQDTARRALAEARSAEVVGQPGCAGGLFFATPSPAVLNGLQSQMEDVKEETSRLTGNLQILETGLATLGQQ